MASMQKLAPFELEIYFAKYEFSAKHLLCCSDAESMKMKDLLALADTESMELWDDLSLSYTECPGLPMLRELISSVKYGGGVKPEGIFCFAGAQEGIYCGLGTMLSKEDHCIVFTPCYQSLKSIPESFCETTSFDLRDDWTVDMTALGAAIKSNTKMIIMNFPHNPTGTLIKLSELEEIIALCRSHDLWLFSDEVYRGLEPNVSDRLPPAATLYEKAVSVGVMSKALGLPGLRLGWLACQDTANLGRIADSKHYLSICNSAPSEALSVIALKNYNTILNRNIEIVRSNLAVIDSFLSRWGHYFEWNVPTGGCCGFMKFTCQEISLKDFAEQLIDKYGVLILPGDNFFTASLDVSRHFRIGFGRANFPLAMKVFEDAVMELIPNAQPQKV